MKQQTRKIMVSLQNILLPLKKKTLRTKKKNRKYILKRKCKYVYNVIESDYFDQTKF